MWKQKQKWTDIHSIYLEITSFCKYILIAINDATRHFLAADINNYNNSDNNNNNQR